MRNGVNSKSATRRIELACQRVMKAIGLGGVLIASPLWAQSVNSQWQAAGGGSWINAANWSNGVPNGLGSAATFGAAISSPSTVTLDGSQIVSSLTFNNSANAYTLAPGNGGTLVLQNIGTSSATLTDQVGAQFITAPLLLNSPTQASVVNPGDTLSASNATIAGGLTFSGAGTLALAATSIVSPSVVTASASTIGSGSLNLGNLTLNAAVQFNGPVSNTMSLIQVTSPSQSVNPNQGAATYGLDDFAAISYPTEPGQVLPGSTVPGFYTQIGPPQQSGNGPPKFTLFFIGNNTYTVPPNLDINVPGQVRLKGNVVAQTVRFDVPNAGFANVGGNDIDQLLLPQMNATLSTTGILITPNVGSNDVLITPDLSGNNQNTQFLTSGNGGTTPNMVIWQNNTAGDLILNTGIEDSAAGPLKLTKEGQGTLVINASSTYTGGTDIEAGDIQIPYNAALGSPAGAIKLNGGTLIAQQTLTLDSGGILPIGRSVVIGPSGGNLTAAAGSTLIVDGPLSGVGTLSIGGNASFTLYELQSATSNSLKYQTSVGVGIVELAGDTSNFGGGISVVAGTLQFSAGTGTHTVSSLVISPEGFLDLTQNNTLLVDYGSQANDPISIIRTELSYGYAPYNPDGPPPLGGTILSSAKSTIGPVAVGYADGDMDQGSPAAANQILLTTTLAGDANLDGIVNFSDLLIVAQDYGKTGQDWSHGDFNYDGIVNFSDLLLVAQNYGLQLSAGQFSQLPESFSAEWQLAEAEIQAGSSNVPEPATAGLLIFGAAAMLARRRRAGPRRV